MNILNLQFVAQQTLIASIAITLALSYSPPAVAIVEAVGKLHQHGSEALERGEKKKAESFFLQAVSIGEKQGFEFSPNSADQLAQLYLEQRRYPEAENMFLKSKKITARDFPKDYRLQIQIELPLAAMYLQIGQVEKALFELKTAGNNWKASKTRKDEPSSEISLKLAEQLSKLSITLVKNNRFADAESCAKLSTEILGSMTDNRYFLLEQAKYNCFLGKMYYKNKRYKLACDTLENGISLQKANNFTVLDWELAEPMHYKVLALRASAQDTRAKSLNAEIAPNWPNYAFVNADDWAEKFTQALNSREGYGQPNYIAARDAVAIASKWGAQDIRLAESEARWGILLYQKGKDDEASPHVSKAINLASNAFAKNKTALAARFEHWGKLIADTNSCPREAPWPLYREALKLRKETVKYKDEAAYKGAKQIANYCKNKLVNSSEEGLFLLFSDACDVMAVAHGLSDARVIDSLHDLIAAREQRYQFERKPEAHAPTIRLYRKVITGEKDAYGAASSEVRETAASSVRYLRQVQMNVEAEKFAQEYKVK
jgi:tetratricopeptide (TPR) repeat protein